jgi:hypothetical protein
MQGHVPADVGDRPQGGATEPLGPAEKPGNWALPDLESRGGLSQSEQTPQLELFLGLATDIAIEPSPGP